MLQRLRLYLARLHAARLRREIDDNERNRVALIRQLDHLLRLEREAAVRLHALENPALFYRPHERARVYR